MIQKLLIRVNHQVLLRNLKLKLRNKELKYRSYKRNCRDSEELETLHLQLRMVMSLMIGCREWMPILIHMIQLMQIFKIDILIEAKSQAGTSLSSKLPKRRDTKSSARTTIYSNSKRNNYHNWRSLIKEMHIKDIKNFLQKL